MDFNSYNPWNSQPANPWYGNSSIPQNTVNTNVYRVTSLEEAIMKTNARGGEMVYFNQSKDEFYNVRVDMNGNKTWQTFVYSVPNPNVNVPVNRADFDNIVSRLEAIESKFKEVGNESNG